MSDDKKDEEILDLQSPSLQLEEKADPSNQHISGRSLPSTNIPTSSNFPNKLYQMLVYAHANNLESIVAWCPSPVSLSAQLKDAGCESCSPFKVHNIAQFEQEVMPQFFQMAKVKSFTRQLNLWGFARLRSSDANNGSYYHKDFIRDNPLRCLNIKRTKVKGLYKRKNQSSSTKLKQDQQNDEMTSAFAMLEESKISSFQGPSMCPQPINLRNLLNENISIPRPPLRDNSIDDIRRAVVFNREVTATHPSTVFPPSSAVMNYGPLTFNRMQPNHISRNNSAFAPAISTPTSSVFTMNESNTREGARLDTIGQPYRDNSFGTNFSATDLRYVAVGIQIGKEQDAAEHKNGESEEHIDDGLGEGSTGASSST